MKISIGICVYNEGKNIGNLLESLMQQELKNHAITEIIVVSSGSTDNTDKIVEEFSNKDNRIKLIRQKKREGKASAVNVFLEKSKEEIVVSSSGDVIFDKNCVENLIRPFDDSKVGMTSVNPIPKNDFRSFMGYAAHMNWTLHNKLGMHGEVIAFRKSLVGKLPHDIAVDEAWVESAISMKGYKAFHVDDAIVYNKGPENISDYFKQRRRNYAGHLDLKKRTSYQVSSINTLQVFKIFLKEALNELTKFHFLTRYIILELFVRLLGWWDFMKKRDILIWDIAESTKEV